MKTITYLKVFIYVLLISLTCAAKAQDKYALIIGNDSYAGSFETLTTCVNDADEMNHCLLSAHTYPVP